MKIGLIGSTGFVGGHLREQYSPEFLYHSKNSHEARGQNFDLLLFSAARAEKWKANQEPDRDAAHMAELVDLLKSIRAERAILMSTVDVYPQPRGVDETVPADVSAAQAYGRNRAVLENAFREQFSDHMIVRLPGLFGTGLKKNIIFDFLNDNNLHQIDSRGSFQFYWLARLRRDLETARAASLQTVNFATAPVTVAQVAREVFGRDFHQEVLPTPASYDMKTRFASLWGRQDGYIQSAEQVMIDLREFVQAEKNRRA